MKIHSKTHVDNSSMNRQKYVDFLSNTRNVSADLNTMLRTAGPRMIEALDINDNIGQLLADADFHASFSEFDAAYISRVQALSEYDILRDRIHEIIFQGRGRSERMENFPVSSSMQS